MRPEKVGESSPKIFRGCYPLRPPIMPNFIEIGQTSLETWGCKLGPGQKFFFILSQTDRNVTTWVATRSVREARLKTIYIIKIGQFDFLCHKRESRYTTGYYRAKRDSVSRATIAHIIQNNMKNQRNIKEVNHFSLCFRYALQPLHFAWTATALPIAHCNNHMNLQA